MDATSGNYWFKIKKVGERCFGDKMYEAAKILFTSVKNNAKIASCLVKLG